MRVMKRWYDEGDDEMIQSNVIFPEKGNCCSSSSSNQPRDGKLTNTEESESSTLAGLLVPLNMFNPLPLVT